MTLSVYGTLKNKDLKHQGLFITEGPYVTRRFLDSGWPLHSVLVAEHLAEEFTILVGGRCPLFTLSEREISKIVGYNFHRGILAAGTRPLFPSLEFMAASQPHISRLVVAPLVSELENLGTIIRNSAALGADAILFGSTGCDPLDRRVIRVSMGSVFSIPMVPITDQHSCVTSLQTLKFEIVGTVLDRSATPLSKFIWPTKTALILGNESTGLAPSWRDACTHLVTIPMQANTDSLNLGVASGIFLHSLLESA